jgi:hypothetical protein
MFRVPASNRFLGLLGRLGLLGCLGLLGPLGLLGLLGLLRLLGLHTLLELPELRHFLLEACIIKLFNFGQILPSCSKLVHLSFTSIHSFV